MKFDDYYSERLASTPSGASSIKLSIESFRRELQRAYMAGFEEARGIVEAAEAMKCAGKDLKQQKYETFIKSLFGG